MWNDFAGTGCIANSKLYLASIRGKPGETMKNSASGKRNWTQKTIGLLPNNLSNAKFNTLVKYFITLCPLDYFPMHFI